jgi:hypothetical protein
MNRLLAQVTKLPTARMRAVDEGVPSANCRLTLRNLTLPVRGHALLGASGAPVDRVRVTVEADLDGSRKLCHEELFSALKEENGEMAASFDAYGRLLLDRVSSLPGIASARLRLEEVAIFSEEGCYGIELATAA